MRISINLYSVLFICWFAIGQQQSLSCQSHPDSLLFSQLTSCFPDYRSGFDESSSIGLIDSVFNSCADKYDFLIRNPELYELKVTGTAAPFDRYVPFTEWLHLMDTTNLQNLTVWYDLENRKDGMIIESLYFSITPNEPDFSLYRSIVRSIIIYRMNKTIISIQDSDLN